METADSAFHNIKLMQTNHQFWTQMLDSWTPFSGLCQLLLHGVVLLKDCGSPGYSDSGLHSYLFSSLQILCWCSGETSLLSSQTSETPGAIKPLLVLLEDETSISMKELSRRKPEGLQHLLVESALIFDLMKHSGSKPSLAENLQLELQQLGLRASPTLPPDSWTSISRLSSAQVRLPTLSGRQKGWRWDLGSDLPEAELQLQALLENLHLPDPSHGRASPLLPQLFYHFSSIHGGS